MIRGKPPGHKRARQDRQPATGFPGTVGAAFAARYARPPARRWMDVEGRLRRDSTGAGDPAAVQTAGAAGTALHSLLIHDDTVAIEASSGQTRP